MDKVMTQTDWPTELNRRKCWKPEILPFPTMFSKAFYLRNIQTQHWLPALVILVPLSTAKN